MPSHGTAACYNSGCRRPECRKDKARLQQAVRDRNVKARDSSGRSTDPRAKHGTLSTYNNYACRCRPCTEAKRKARG